jgi:hypothetical protein
MVADGAAVATHGIGMDLDQACRLADTAPLVDVFQDREDLVLRQVGAVQRCALAFGEAIATGAAIEQSILLGLAQTTGDGEVCGASAAEVGALEILTTELSEIVHGLRSGPEREERTRLGLLV